MTDKLKASKCSCGKISIPPVEFCSLCDARPELVDIGSSAIVLSFTRLHVTTSEFDAPLGIALVELKDGTRLMCNANSDCNLNIGDRITLTLKDNRLYTDL